MESFLRDLLSKNSFHHVLGSIHPQLPYYKNLFFHNDVVNFQRIYFRHLAQAAESGLFDTLAHPDLVKNVFPDRWNVNTVMEDVRESLDRIARTGVSMELNTSGTHKAIREMNPSLQILSEMNQRSIPVVIGSDAHTPQRVAAGFSSAIELLREAGYENVHYFLERKRHVVSLEAVRLSLYQERVREDAIPRPV
jgi:histidinol-phosphatase (PHP family)